MASLKNTTSNVAGGKDSGPGATLTRPMRSLGSQPQLVATTTVATDAAEAWDATVAGVTTG